MDMKNVENYEISYPEALKALAAKLKDRPRGKDFSFDEYYIVLTPDRYTLQVEKELFGGGGAIDCEVLTLSRLCRRVCGDTVTLSTEGAVMLIARAAAQAEGLEYYGNAAEYPEFARNVYAALSQISSSAIPIDSVAAEVSSLPDRGGNTGRKLRDLAEIKKKYDELKKEKKFGADGEDKKTLDAPDRLKELAAAAKTSELIKKSHFFVIGYADATQLIGEVFCAIKKHAKSFEVYGAIPIELKKALNLKACDIPKIEPKKNSKLEVYKATDAIAEYKEVASYIRDYVCGTGKRYGDISVVAPNPRALTRILNEYGIKYNADTSVALYDTAQFTALANIIRLSSESDADTVVSLCKSPYSSVKPEWADALDYELTSRGIKHNVFDAKIKSADGRAAIERIKKIVSEFKKVACLYDGSSKTEEEPPSVVYAPGKFSEACSAVIDFCDFETRESEIAKNAEMLTGDSGIVMTDAVKPIRSLLELMDRYGTDDGDFKTDARMFFSAAKAVSVKSLPRYTDRVSVGSVEALRLKECELLIVVDFNEGVLPVPTADAGLLSDADILVTKGKIKPSAKEKNRRSRDELLFVLSNAKKAACFYCDSGEAKKASLLSAISDYEIKDGKKVYVGSDKRIREELSKAAKGDDKALALQTTRNPKIIAYHACVPSAARELSARKKTSYGKALDEAVERYEKIKEKEAELNREKYTRRKSAPFVSEVKKGVVRHESLSVSELSDWFSCPYKRFLKYTVGLKERKTGEFSAPDFGTLMHMVLQWFVTNKLYDSYDESVNDFDADTLETIKTNALNIANDAEFVLSEKDKERFVENACDYVRVNARIIKGGKYRPDLKWIEKQFLGDILLGEAKIPFKGTIDRVDVKKDGDDAASMLRVIDYKTGKKELNIKKIEDGREMQLSLYAAELIAAYGKNESGDETEKAKVTGMFYIPLPKKYESERNALLSGTMLKDYGIAIDYDNKIFTLGESKILKLKSNDDRTDFLGDSKKSKTIIDESKFNGLIDISVKNACLAADQIEGGYIERSPAEDNECQYCAFVGLCEHKLVRSSAEDEGNDND